MSIAADANRSLHGLSYRPEVDGLRAVAVIPVILFHAGLPIMPGGFFGVDVFFVISGYLITRILVHDLMEQRFSILRFYERRARRILPALFLVMAFTLAPAWMLLPPEQLNIYFGSLRATALFYSNIHFHQNNGYFSPSAEDQPLLHTWSLAVEEQFYVVFPLLLWVMWRLAQRRLSIAFMAMAGAGFALCLWQLDKSADAAFYLFHARAWELLVGAAVAAGSLKQLPEPSPVTIGAGLAGLLLVLASYFIPTAPSWVPGWPTLLPVLGTALMLVTITSDTIVGRLLSLPPVVGLGLVSYSAYLWHQPLFAFARLAAQQAPSPGVMIALSILALGLAYLSWQYVELPFRHQQRLGRRGLFATAAAGMLSFSVLGSLALQADWARDRLSPDQLARIEPPLSKVTECAWIAPVASHPDIRLCPLNEAAGAPVLLWGDSHAQALASELAASLKKQKWPGYYIESHRCLRIPGVASSGSANDEDETECEELRRAFHDYLKQVVPRAIVVNMRWNLRVFPVPGADDHVGFDNGEGGEESEDDRLNYSRSVDGRWVTDAEPKRRAIVEMLAKLSRLARIVVVGPVPEVGWHVGDLNFKALHVQARGLPDVSTSYARFLERNRFTLDVLDEAETKTEMLRVEPSRLLCNVALKDRCVAQFDGTTYYADDDHLSSTGARMVIDQVEALIGR